MNSCLTSKADAVQWSQ